MPIFGVSWVSCRSGVEGIQVGLLRSFDIILQGGGEVDAGQGKAECREVAGDVARERVAGR